MPAARSYPESLHASRQLQQQQHSPLRAPGSQADPRGGGGGPAGRLLQQHAAPQGRGPARGGHRATRPAMGSEADEADSEVKWFTDEAFRSLSGPEADYLDMYAGSHRSSTNASQPSTQDSPAGANAAAAWLSYADLRGSAPRLDSEDLPRQQPYSASYGYPEGLDPSKRYEMGSFECVDVAVEREEPRRGRRGVPKRQIQLKRRNTAESRPGEGSGGDSPVVPVEMDSPSLPRRNKGGLVRQHSTPAALEDSYRPEPSPEPAERSERKSRLQKSASLDETWPKTKMATCLIKSVLSKKMQHVGKQSSQQEEDDGPPFEDNNPPPEGGASPVAESLKTGTHLMSSSLHSDYSLCSEDLPVHRDASEAKSDRSRQRGSGASPGVWSDPHNTAANDASRQSSADKSRSPSGKATPAKPDMRSELQVPFDGRRPAVERESPGAVGGTPGDGGKPAAERGGDDSAARDTAGNADAPAGRPGTSHRDEGRVSAEPRSSYMSKTPEITLKPSPATEKKKKSSMNVSLAPETSAKPDAWRRPASPPGRDGEEGRAEEGRKRRESKEEDAEAGAEAKAKVPMHRVRDVRRMVKNTYNLSFKPTSATLPPQEREARGEERMEDERREERREERQEEQREEGREEKPFTPTMQRRGLSQPMQIECKAVSWRENKNKATTATTIGGRTTERAQPSPQQLSSHEARDPENSSYVTLAQQLNNRGSCTTEEASGTGTCQPDTPTGPAEGERQRAAEPKADAASDAEEKPEVARRDGKPPMLGSIPRVPSKDREVSSALLVLQDGSGRARPPQAQPQPQPQPQAPVSTPTQAQSASPSPGLASAPAPGGSGSHSVSTLLKEKGYQADIGSMVSEGPTEAGVVRGGGGEGVPRKHVNRLEIPLQTSSSEGAAGPSDARRERTFSSSSSAGASPFPSQTPSVPNAAPVPAPAAPSLDEGTPATGREEESAEVRPVAGGNAQPGTPPPRRRAEQQTAPPLRHGELEAVKKQGPPVCPKSPATRRFRPQPIEVRSTSNDAHRQEAPGSSRPQTIELRSIANSAQKPAVPPKPNCSRFKPADVRSLSNESQRTPAEEAATWNAAQQNKEDRPAAGGGGGAQKQPATPPTLRRQPPNDTPPASNYTRKLAVSAVSSYRAPQSKTTAATAVSGLSSSVSEPAERDASSDRTQRSGTPSQRPAALGAVPTSAPGSDPGPGPSSQSAVVDLRSHPQYPKTTAHAQEHAMPITLSATQAPEYTHAHTQQSTRRSLGGERARRSDDLRFYASDDPPSYDERESFSPLLLPDLTPRQPGRYHPAPSSSSSSSSSRPAPCSCASGCPSHPGVAGLPPPHLHPHQHPHHHHHQSPHTLTPPAGSHSPGQAQPYPPTSQPPPRPHPQPLGYQSASPKSGQPPAMYQPLHQHPANPNPPHPSMLQPLPPPQHLDPRRPSVHRSPQQQQQQGGGVGMGGPYSEHGHSHSPSLAPMDADPRYLCGPQGLGPSYGSEYGSDGSSLYQDGAGGLGYGQTPRRVLLDPETGKYFYIEVPVQPLRKMLFDPETGQYVEVLIPQQAMSHSGLYPPSTAPYPPLHNPNMYAPAPQYLPYAVPPPPPPPAHPQAPPQPPRHPEAPGPGTMHHGGAGLGYRSPSGQGSKPEAQSHPPLDQSYLESMYYVPTGMTASPNPTPPDYYHKHPSSLPATAGKRA